MPQNPYHPNIDVVPARTNLSESIEALIMRGALATPEDRDLLVREILCLTGQQSAAIKDTTP